MRARAGANPNPNPNPNPDPNPNPNPNPNQVVPLCKAAGYTLTPIDAHFSDVSKLSHGSLRDYATSILAALAATKVKVRFGVRAS